MPPLLLYAVATLALLQEPRATVVGTVRDGETQTPIAGAVVALSDLSRATTADGGGRYALTDVPAGPQHLTVRLIGYAPRILHALVPREGELEINVALRAELHHLRTIEVRPAVAVRGLDNDDDPFPDRSASIAAVRNHPLLAEPDALEALGGGEVVVSAETPSGVHVRGGGSDQTAYLLDGIPVLSPYHSAGLFSAWNPDVLSSLTLTSSGPSPGTPAALSGTIAGVTRTPGDRLHAQGSLSNTQGRLTVGGPLGGAGAGYLVSVRSGFPGGVTGEADPSYLHGESGDWLAKLDASALGGGVRLLVYENDNELNAAAVAGAEAQVNPSPRRNRFTWHSRSLGGEWGRTFGRIAVRVQGWGASTGSTAAWSARAGLLAMTSARRDLGGLASLVRRSAGARMEVGLRLERSNTEYRVEPDSGGDGLGLSARTPVVTLFVDHASAVGRHVELELGASAAVAAGDPYVDPGARLRWRLSDGLTLSGSYVRRHQFAQSLRNAESVVGNVFPADLFVGSAAPGVPVARSDQAVVGAELRPSAGVRIGGQAYARTFGGLTLVAPRSGEPFTAAAFAVGSGRSLGASVEASLSTARYALLASYGLQQVRLGDSALRYVPEYGTTHLLEAGVILFPTATSSIRLGLTGAAGRRATTASGAVEWEACNLSDKGCELGGSPHYDGAALGRTKLPPYLRLDVGLRKHWHFEVGGRDAVVALFGTMTNVLGRTNVLTYAEDPATGGLAAVEMRPFSPLVVGLDWQF